MMIFIFLVKYIFVFEKFSGKNINVLFFSIVLLKEIISFFGGEIKVNEN